MISPGDALLSIPIIVMLGVVGWVLWVVFGKGE